MLSTLGGISPQATIQAIMIGTILVFILSDLAKWRKDRKQAKAV